MMIVSPPTQPLPRDRSGRIIYKSTVAEPLANDTEHLTWITFLKNGLDDWFANRTDVFVAADLLWYPVKGAPDTFKAPDVMVVLNRPAGHRRSYQQWLEQDRPPQVVFEFQSDAVNAAEMMDKLDFYSDAGCEEFYIYDYQRNTFRAFQRPSPEKALSKIADDDNGCWVSPALGMTFGLDCNGDLWVRRPDGKLMETQRQIWARAEAEALRAEAEALRAERLAAKLRALGIDPDAP